MNSWMSRGDHEDKRHPWQDYSHYGRSGAGAGLLARTRVGIVHFIQTMSLDIGKRREGRALKTGILRKLVAGSLSRENGHGHSAHVA